MIRWPERIVNKMITHKFIKFINKIYFQTVFSLFVWISLAAWVTVPYSFNPSAMIRFGHYYTHQNPGITPPGAVHFIGNEEHGGNGYDGQIFYYYARTLLFYGEWPKGFQDAYRAPRAGYPLLAAVFPKLIYILLSAAGFSGDLLSAVVSWSTVASMIFWQIALLLYSGILLYRMLPENLKYLNLIYLNSPFVLQSWMLLLSDTIMMSLVVTGVYFFFRIYKKNEIYDNNAAGRPDYRNLFYSFSAFSLAVLTKESSLVLLFPLGLYALIRRDLLRAGLMISVLLPMVIWQMYLRSVHGMVPAGVLSVFLSPFEGIAGLLTETAGLLSGLSDPSLRTENLKLLIKSFARWLLILIILSAIYAAADVIFRKVYGFIKSRSHQYAAAPFFALGALLNIMTLIMADYYYFWSVYENVSRMLTISVPAVILMKISDNSARIRFYVFATVILSFMIVIRTLFLAAVYPYDFF